MDGGPWWAAVYGVTQSRTRLKRLSSSSSIYYVMWCYYVTVALEKTLERPLDYKEIQPVDPKGDQSWVFIGRTDVEAETPVLWPPDVKS